MSGIGNAFNNIGSGIKNAYVNLTGPAAPAGALPYDQQMLQAKRQQAMADALMEQAQSDIPIQSYKGVQAAIPWTAVLAKALQGGAASWKRGQAEKAEDAASAQDTKQLQSQADLYAAAMSGSGAQPAAPPAAPVAPITAQPQGAPADIVEGPGAPMAPAGPVGAPPAPGAVPPGTAPAPAPGAGLTRQQVIAALMRGDGGPKSQANAAMLIPLLMARDEKLEDRNYAEGRSKVRPLTEAERAQYKIDPKTPAVINADGMVTTIDDKNQITNFQAEQLRDADLDRGLQQQQVDISRQNANRPQVGTPGSVLVDNNGKVVARIPYSPEQQRAFAALDRSEQTAVIKSDQAIDELERMMKMPGKSTALGFKTPLSGIPFMGGYPGSKRKDFEEVLKTFQAKTFGDAVREMELKGSLSDAEGSKIMASVAALSGDMSEAEFDRSAGAIWKQMSEARNRLPGAKAVHREFGKQPPWAVTVVETGVDQEGNKFHKMSDGTIRDAR